MLGDKIHILPEYYAPAEEILKTLLPQLQGDGARHVIVIGGESGSGKSVLSSCLAEGLRQKGLAVALFQLDDYFHLPPADNHAARLADRSKVGLQEVNMLLLQDHLDAFKHHKNRISKPVSSHFHNTIAQEIYDFEEVEILILEGTYALYLQNADTKIFIARTYLDTLTQRIARGRDVIDDFTNKILEIEHKIVLKSSENADFVVNKDYSVNKCSR
jgi:uridine kinase